jgi:hypothetical protein
LRKGSRNFRVVAAIAAHQKDLNIVLGGKKYETIDLQPNIRLVRICSALSEEIVFGLTFLEREQDSSYRCSESDRNSGSTSRRQDFSSFSLVPVVLREEA